MCMYAVCFKRERSARRPPVFPASHCWNQVLTIIQSSYGLLAHGSPGNWVKPLSHQPAGLVPLSILCPGFQLSCWKKWKFLFSRDMGYPFTYCLFFLAFPSRPLTCSCCSETLPRIYLNYSLLLTNPARHWNPQPPLLDSPTVMASSKRPLVIRNQAKGSCHRYWQCPSH